MKQLTILYALLLMLIIGLANKGYYTYIFQWIREIPYGDKIGHFILIGLLSLLVNLSLKCAHFKIGSWFLLKGSLFVLIVVTLEEFSQLWIETRTFDLGDLGCDYLGILVFGYLAYVFYSKVNKVTS